MADGYLSSKAAGKRPDRSQPAPGRYKNPIGDASKLPKARPPPKGKQRAGSSANADTDDEEYESGDESSDLKDFMAERARIGQERMRQAAYEQQSATNSTEAWKARLPKMYPAPGDSEETLQNKERGRSAHFTRRSEQSETTKRRHATRDNAQAATARSQTAVAERDFAYRPDHPLHADSRRAKDRAKDRGQDRGQDRRR